MAFDEGSSVRIVIMPEPLRSQFSSDPQFQEAHRIWKYAADKKIGTVHGHRHIGPSKPDIEHVVTFPTGLAKPDHLDYIDIPGSRLEAVK